MMSAIRVALAKKLGLPAMATQDQVIRTAFKKMAAFGTYTDKKIVETRYPGANAFRSSDSHGSYWVIHISVSPGVLAQGSTESEAWANAADVVRRQQGKGT